MASPAATSPNRRPRSRRVNMTPPGFVSYRMKDRSLGEGHSQASGCQRTRPHKEQACGRGSESIEYVIRSRDRRERFLISMQIDNCRARDFRSIVLLHENYCSQVFAAPLAGEAQRVYDLAGIRAGRLEFSDDSTVAHHGRMPDLL